jgi:hypothetical protein
MDAQTESRLLGLLSVALAIFGVAAPYKWRDMPEWVTDTALMLAAFLALWAVWLGMPRRWKLSLQSACQYVLLWMPRKQVVAPLLTIALGLLIVIGGVAWLYVRSGTLAASGGPAPLSVAVAHPPSRETILPTPTGAPAAPSPSSPSSTAWAPTAPYDVDKKLAAIDALLIMTNGGIEGLVKKGLGIMPQWSPLRVTPNGRHEFRIMVKGYWSDMLSVRDKMYAFQRDNEKYDDIYSLSSPTICEPLLGELDEIVNALQHTEQSDADYSFFLNPYLARLDKVNSTLIVWRDRERTALLQRRNELTAMER